MENENVTIYLRVLGYREPDSTWAAHCLETDLVGYGNNFESALRNLQELTEMQISFALYKKQPALLDRPAPPEIFEVYNSIFRSCLQQSPECNKLKHKRQVTSIPWPKNISGSDFALAQMLSS